MATTPSRPGHALLELVAVMDRLRSPGGCPWDAEQTHRSLARHLLEETYEVLEALDSGDRDHLREELGDLLLQVVFHARLAQEDPSDPWGVDEVARGITDKLVRRHPHVFGPEPDPAGDGAVAAGAGGAGAAGDGAAEVRAAGDGAARDGAAEVATRWDRLKAAEKHRTSVLDGIPLALPALAYADAVLGRVRRAGLAVDLPADDSLGARLLDLVAEGHASGLDPEAALRRTAGELAGAVGALEAAGPEAAPSEAAPSEAAPSEAAPPTDGPRV